MTKLVATLKLLGAAAAVLALQACATACSGYDSCLSRSPRLDAGFGDAVNIAKAQQTLNPDASRNRNAVAGIDGKAAQDTMARYHESFKSPPPPTNLFTIGVSSGGGGGGGQ